MLTITIEKEPRETELPWSVNVWNNKGNEREEELERKFKTEREASAYVAVLKRNDSKTIEKKTKESKNRDDTDYYHVQFTDKISYDKVMMALNKLGLPFILVEDNKDTKEKKACNHDWETDEDGMVFCKGCGELHPGCKEVTEDTYCLEQDGYRKEG